VELWVDAVGAPPLTYQWSKDGVAIPGATAFNLVLTAVTPDDAGSYSVVVTNPGGSTESLAATISVGTLPVITVQPADEDAATGATVTLAVSADGSPAPTFQWLKDGAPISGATSYVLVLADAQPSDGGVYQVLVTNNCGTVTSDAANVSVNAPPVLSCNGAVALWSPNHELVDVQSAFGVSDPDGDEVSLTIRIFSDESEIPETGDGTGKHAPDFKNELYDGRGLLLRSERRGKEDGRWYVAVITADDGNGGVTQGVCLLAACPHDQDQTSLDAALAQGAAAAASIQAAVDAGTSLPLSGMYEHGLAAPLGPIQ